jgi:uncharacterized zinc-type alcohol dehydrogenase-like protein
MTATLAYAAPSAKSPLAPFHLERRDPRDGDVVIDILFCGVCHSDIHQVRDEWGGATFPMVPGHEIVGRVAKAGARVTRFKVGDLAGVGCMVDSCRTCASCDEGLENFCETGFVGTYNARERDGKAMTQGGYSGQIVVDEAFTLRIAPSLDPARTAPLLCAGITTYSPLRHWKVGPGQTVGIVGLGGLGHMGVKFARAFGARVVVFTTSPKKRDDALKLGAHEVVVSTEPGAFKPLANRLDFILDTVSAPHDLNQYLPMLRRDGAMVLVGIPDEAPAVQPFSLIMKRRQLAGSLIGGILETQEMLDFCAKHEILSDIEVIPIQKINEAYERMLKGDVKYRFVIDMQSLKA